MPNNTNLGAIHIKLPFKSMDDVEFSGAYGGIADALVQKLRAHLQETGGEPNPEQNENEEESNPEDSGNISPDQVLQRLKP